jgi:hypothetical protein
MKIAFSLPLIAEESEISKLSELAKKKTPVAVDPLEPADRCPAITPLEGHKCDVGQKRWGGMV